MYPNVYIAEDFLKIFDDSYKELAIQSIYDTDAEIESKRASLIRIRDLFLSSNVQTDLKDRSLIKYYKQEFGVHKSIGDLVFHSLIKENSVAGGRKLETGKQPGDCNESNFCFFINEDSETSKLQSHNEGRIVLGNEFLNEPFYLKHTFPTESTDETIPQIEKSKHPCSSLIIIDRYLFADASKTEKLPHLINFLKQLIHDGITHPFEIDIITENDNNDSKIESKYNRIREVFPSISLHIYAAPNLEEHDRYFITNYAIFSVGLPFLGKSNISCNFYPSQGHRDSIKKAYEHWLSKIKLSKGIITKNPKSLGLVKTVWKSDNLEHSIFKLAH